MRATETDLIEKARPTRISVFAPDIPYPANRGGRADVWRRIVAMSKLGLDIQLICFYDDIPGKRPTGEHRTAVLSVAQDLRAFPVHKGIAWTARRLPQIALTPWHVVCRTLSGDALHELVAQVRAFDPGLIWCEGPLCGLIARDTARALGKPLIYRSHNIEHLYLRRQAAVARSRRDRLAWTVACFGLERFEVDMLRSADWIFDISRDDMAFWQQRGHRNISWLPPVAESALAAETPCAETSPTNDVVFLGNLTTPNNIRGVEWLIQDIRPLVLAQRPGTRFLVAGSNPGAYIRQLCMAPGVTLLADVPDAPSVYASARVLVNPVRTGSGTHVKAIEMLMTRAPIVTATQGTQGLPPEIKRLFRVADNAEAFAAQVLAALQEPPDAVAERGAARRLFGLQGLSDALVALQQHLHPGTSQRH